MCGLSATARSIPSAQSCAQLSRVGVHTPHHVSQARFHRTFWHRRGGIALRCFCCLQHAGVHRFTLPRAVIIRSVDARSRGSSRQTILPRSCMCEALPFTFIGPNHELIRFSLAQEYGGHVVVVWSQQDDLIGSGNHVRCRLINATSVA